MGDLLPCPFCGSKNIGERYVSTCSVDSSYDTFGCLDCCAVFVDGSEIDWNRRASPQPSAEAAQCPDTCEGYPGIAADFEDAKMRLKAARYFFASPKSFSQEEFKDVGRTVTARDDYDQELPNTLAVVEPAPVSSGAVAPKVAVSDEDVLLALQEFDMWRGELVEGRSVETKLTNADRMRFALESFVSSHPAQAVSVPIFRYAQGKLNTTTGAWMDGTPTQENFEWAAHAGYIIESSVRAVLSAPSPPQQEKGS